MVRLILLGVLLSICGRVVAAPPVSYHDPSGYFPFVHPIITPGDGLVSISHWNPGPAGELGFVQVRDGQFYVGEERIRFWGTNLAFAGAFPTRGEARFVAEKMSRFGINLVRFHSMDATDERQSLIAKGKGHTQELDPAYLDRLDQLVYQLKENGIYVNINLHVNRVYQSGDGVLAELTTAKTANLFDPHMIQLQKDYARALLTHVNPYTGNPYTHEPAVAQIEITNENSFFYQWYSGRVDEIPPVYREALADLFNEWLRQRYETTQELSEAWQDPSRPFVRGLLSGESLEEGVGVFTVSDRRTPQAMEDWMRFLYELEYKYFQEMRDFLVEELGVQSLITGTMSFPLTGQMVQAELMDYLDIHGYWQHPTYSQGSWQGSWTFGNSPMLQRPTGNTLTWLSSARVQGKPYVVSEYNHIFPSFYEAEGLPLIAAYGARQDWDGIYIFNFNASGAWMRNQIGFFDLDVHPVKLAQMIVGASLFRRGDLAPAQAQHLTKIPLGAAIRSNTTRSWSATETALADWGIRQTNSPDRRSALIYDTTDPSRQAEVLLAEDPIPGPFQWKEGLATVITDPTVVAMGFIQGQEIQLGDVVIQALPTPNQFAVISLTALEATATPIRVSHQVLVIAAGRSENTWTMWNQDYTSVTNWGYGPVVTEGIPAIIRVETEAERVVVYALDDHGRILGEVPHQRQGSTVIFTIGPEYQTIWYLIHSE